MLRASAEGLSRTVNEVLDLCRLETGRLVLDRQPFDLRSEVDVSLDRVASMAAERGIDLSYRIEGAAPSTLLGDAARLRHVLATLLTYAVRRTHEGGVTLSVSTRPVPPDRHEVTLRRPGHRHGHRAGARRAVVPAAQPHHRDGSRGRRAGSRPDAVPRHRPPDGRPHRAPERSPRRLDVRVHHDGGEPRANASDEVAVADDRAGRAGGVPPASHPAGRRQHRRAEGRGRTCSSGWDTRSTWSATDKTCCTRSRPSGTT